MTFVIGNESDFIKEKNKFLSANKIFIVRDLKRV